MWSIKIRLKTCKWQGSFLCCADHTWIWKYWVGWGWCPYPTNVPNHIILISVQPTFTMISLSLQRQQRVFWAGRAPWSTGMALGRRLGNPRNHCERTFASKLINIPFYKCVVYKTLLAQHPSYSWWEAAQDPIRRCSCLSSHHPASWCQRLSSLHSDQRLWSLCGHSTVERRQ